MTDNTYNGWKNRETWAFMLHVNNDQGLQADARDVVRAAVADGEPVDTALREWTECLFTRSGSVAEFGDVWPDALADAAEEIGSLWRVDWFDCADSVLADIAEDD